MKKVVLKKFLVCILIVVIASNFILGSCNTVYAAEEFSLGAFGTNIVTGLIGILTWVTDLPKIALIIGISDLISSLARVSMSDLGSTYGEQWLDNFVLTPFHVLFNKIPLVDINFFDFSATGTIGQFREAVAGWYYTMRLLAAMILLIVLVYIGIRMALTSIASEKAMYKKMLVDWVTSLALLFLLHYIMLFVFSCNNALVDAMAKLAEETPGIDTIMTQIQLLCFHYDLVVRKVAMIIYGMLLFQTVLFLVAYIKRMLTIGFLIIIAPLITITYSMDKIGDGKAQALNTWLKEFAYNILIQPFQCILYLVFAKIVCDLMWQQTFHILSRSNVGVAIFAILCMQFINEGEKIVKKIFGFGKASVAGDLAAGIATAGAILKGKDVARKYGSNLMKTKNTMLSSKAAKTMGAYANNRRLDKVAKKLEEADNNSNSATNNTASNLKPNTDSSKERRNIKFTSANQKLSSMKQDQEKIANQLNNQNNGEKDYRALAKMEIEKQDKAKAAEKAEKAAKKAEKKKINDDPKTLGGALFKAYKETINDNKNALAGMNLGMFTAGMGLVTSNFGDFSRGIAGYGMGKGFVEGIYENSDEELIAQTKSASQLYANLTGVTDSAQQLANAQVAGANDLNKDIKEALKDLKNVLAGFRNRESMIGQFNKTALDKDNAGTITRTSISTMLDENGFKGSDEEKAKIIDSFSNYGALLATQSLSNSINNAEGMGHDREELAMLIGNRTLSKEQVPNSSANPEGVENVVENHETQVEETETREEVFKDMPVDQIASAVVNALQNNLNGSSSQSATVNIPNLETTQHKIEELNSLIGTLESKNSSDRDKIIEAISQNNTNIKSYDDAINELRTQRDNLQSQIK